MDEICKEIRRLTVECIGSIGSGHIGGSMSIAELMKVLYFEKMNIDPENPKMEGRDRLVVSKGHAGPVVYATLALKGFFPKDWLYTLNKFGTNLPSHCDMNKTPGVDMTAGSLGQGFSCAVGIAIGSKIKKDGATIYTIIGVVVFLLGILAIFLVQDVSVDTSKNQNYFGNIFYGFRPSVIKNNKLFYIILAAYATFCISIQIFMPYLILYYNVSLGMENYVLIMAPAVIIAAIVTAFYGRVYDRFHFKVAVMPAIGTLMLGYVLLYLFQSTVFVFVGSLFMMSGYLMGMAVFGAMLRDYTPQNRAGMFQGLRIVGQVLIPGIVGPWIGAMVLRNAEQVLNDDGTYSFIPNANIFLAAFVAACFILLILAVIFKLTKKAKED